MAAMAGAGQLKLQQSAQLGEASPLQAAAAAAAAAAADAHACRQDAAATLINAATASR